MHGVTDTALYFTIKMNLKVTRCWLVCFHCANLLISTQFIVAGENILIDSTNSTGTEGREMWARGSGNKEHDTTWAAGLHLFRLVAIGAFVNTINY